MRNCILLLVAFFLIKAVNAQTVNIKGKVIDAVSGESVAGATVSLDSVAISATDISGSFYVTATAGKHILGVKMVSFTTERVVLNLTDVNEEQLVIIRLTPSSQELGTVVVSAGKFEQRIEEVTVSMEVVKPAQIHERNTTTMEDAIDQIPGVNIVDGQANIRGGSGWSYGAGSRVQVLVDDLPQLTADANDAKWTFLPIENLEQVEVIKGASSVLFGSSALNGVINIRTAYPKSEPITRVTMFTGVYDKPVFRLANKDYNLKWWGNRMLKTAGNSFFHSEKVGQLDVTIGSNIFSDEGYRQGEKELRGRFNMNTRYRFKKLEGLSAGINFNTMTTDGTLFFLWKNDTTGAYIPATNTLSNYRTYRTNVDPFVTYSDKKGNSFRLRTRLFETKNENNTSQNSSADLYYSELQYQKKINENFNLTSGVVAINSKVRSELYGDHSGNQLAFYLQGDLKWKKFTFSAGGRAEQNKVDSYSDKVTPVFRAGVNYHLANQTYLRGSAGQGYRFPSIAEKFIRTNVGSIVVYPNEDLEPEKGVSYEFGIRQGLKVHQWLGYVDVAVFRNEYSHMMEFAFAQWGKFTDPFIGNGFKSMNVGDTRITGMEITLGGTGKLFGDLEMTVLLGHTYLNPIQLTYDSLYASKVGIAAVYGSDSTNILKYRSKFMFKGDIDFKWRKFSLGISLHYMSRMENVDKIFVSGLLDFAFAPGLGIGNYRNYHHKGDIIYDLRTSCRFSKNVELAFIVKNLLNTIYMQRPADMQAPRIFVGQVTFTL